jgi:hypothetical protein
MKKGRCGVYQARFNRLWALLLVCDPHGMAEMTPSMIAGVIGCSERYAQTLLFERIRFRVCRK